MSENGVDEYLDAQPAPRARRLRELRDLIERLCPRARVSMKYRMPTFECEEGWVAIANQKHYVSLYTCSAVHLEAFRLAHPKIRTGKGCVNLRDRDELPVRDLEPVIRSALSKRKP